jgi:uncharacterized protein (TIGR02145 family)
MKLFLSLLALTFNISLAAKENASNSTIKDPRDGKTYKTVKIGEQLWMAENLNYEAEGSKCYDNKPANCEKYGRMYNWNAAMKACPTGWHLPSDEEWTTLTDFVGAPTAGTKLKAKSGWNDNGNGTDAYGFSALPGGAASYDDLFETIGYYGLWWSSSELNASYAYVYAIFYNNKGTYYDEFANSGLFSVRCVFTSKENASDSTTKNIKDTRTYKTVKIGEQVWMAENLNYNANGSRCYDNKPANCEKYGRLYNWKTAKTVCPTGWHLPSNDEWIALINFVGGLSTAGTKLKARSGWNSDGNGEDKYGFSALPGGTGDIGGNFSNMGNSGFWWSSNEYGYGNEAYYWLMYHDVNGIYFHYGFNNLSSVRCVQD